MFDSLLRFLIPLPERYLNKNEYPFESYPTNPRKYFDEIKEGEKGEIYTIKRNKGEHREDLSWKETNKTKVLIIGDSFTFGQGIRYEDTFIKKVEKLSKSYIGINFGISGADIDEIFQDFSKNTKEVNSDIVLYGLCPNDIVLDPKDWEDFNSLIKVNKSFETKDSRKVWDFLNLRNHYFNELEDLGILRKSHIVELISYHYTLSKVTNATIDHYRDIYNFKKNANGLKKTLDYIREMKLISEDRGARFAVVLFPLLYWPGGKNPFAAEYEGFKGVLKDHGVNYYDPLPSLMRFNDRDLWVHPLDQHPNEIANEIIAKDILSFLDSLKVK